MIQFFDWSRKCLGLTYKYTYIVENGAYHQHDCTVLIDGSSDAGEILVTVESVDVVTIGRIAVVVAFVGVLDLDIVVFYICA
jgi:hypothetical protein